MRADAIDVDQAGEMYLAPVASHAIETERCSRHVTPSVLMHASVRVDDNQCQQV